MWGGGLLDSMFMLDKSKGKEKKIKLQDVKRT
jgi:hypothetical protein